MMRWVEIGDGRDERRLRILSEVLTRLGVENEFSVWQVTREDFKDKLRDAKANFDQIRFSGLACELGVEQAESSALSALHLGAADSLVRSDGGWWPRNFLSDGLHLAIVSDVSNLQLKEGVFVLGTNWRAQAGVAALSRIGFQRFTVSDVNDESAESFLRSVEKVHFGATFQFVNRQMITQLPSVHAVALNTLTKGEDDGILDELVYFNFLALGGLWLDLPFDPINEGLAEEANAAGAFVESPLHVVAASDQLWAETCIRERGFKFDRAAYIELLRERFSSPAST